MMLRRRNDVVSAAVRSPGALPAQTLTHAYIRFPTWHEQLVQFLTRYLFATLGLLFFNYGAHAAPTWLPLTQINVVFIVYLVLNSINLLHARLHPQSAARYRLALLIDIAMVTLSVINDPNQIPPSMVAYIVVVLGNGMRYGIRFFAEALIATLVGAILALSTRYGVLHLPMPQGTLFLTLFGALIVIYAYILMGRIERSRQRSEERSRTDVLTGLLNRRGLRELVEMRLNSKQWMTSKPIVVFADLDNFKTVNDNHGHAEGDRVLAMVGSLLKKTLRDHDLIARYGGDEFLVLLTDVELHEAQEILSRVQGSIEAWFRANNLACGISMGFATAPHEEWNLDKVLHNVDSMLYQSKAKRNAAKTATPVDINPA
ncbi:MAG TPA: GGDEF domain-containing protein [Steroidobacteraceae bacterium]|jgi:diguanylate cyclase (GGDEF)-like protein|nr:GGDEF domain-containing protein [Steroidobacteraceae bacterium]